MNLESYILNFYPEEGVDYIVHPSGAWVFQTKLQDISLIVVREYLNTVMTENHTIRIEDVGYNHKAIDVVDTYTSIWSAMDVISVCLLREDARIKWIHTMDNQIVVGMTFRKHELPYGLYMVNEGKLKMITDEMGG